MNDDALKYPVCYLILIKKKKELQREAVTLLTNMHKMFFFHSSLIFFYIINLTQKYLCIFISLNLRSNNSENVCENRGYEKENGKVVEHEIRGKCMREASS